MDLLKEQIMKYLQIFKKSSFLTVQNQPKTLEDIEPGKWRLILKKYFGRNLLIKLSTKFRKRLCHFDLFSNIANKSIFFCKMSILFLYNFPNLMENCKK